jgi:voltage-dependent calcium channel alpha-2/delta-3
VESSKGQVSNYVDGNCKKTCESGEYDCYVLDDNGFILISEKHEHTGRFFGEIDGMVMEMLVNSDVYKRVRVVDYQAVCFQPLSKTNFGNFLRTVGVEWWCISFVGCDYFNDALSYLPFSRWTT